MQVPVGHEVVSQGALKLELNYRQVPRKCLFSLKFSQIVGLIAF